MNFTSDGQEIDSWTRLVLFNNLLPKSALASFRLSLMCLASTMNATL